MLTLNDGRSELWQWDTGRTLTVDADCSQVHFSNKVFGRSIDVDVVDGAAIIPDILLQTDKDLNVWAFVGTSENGYTKISKTFKVNRRNKPADYVFTPPDQTSLEEIKEKIDYLESIQDPDAIKNAVNDYLEQNPVEAPVQSVNGKTGTVELTAKDVGAISQGDLQEATNNALAQAKASGLFDGAPGSDGKDGITPTIGANGNWYIGDTDTGKPSRGDKGDTGDTGPAGSTGPAGAAGKDGKSAYQYAQEGGYTGTEAEFATKLAEEIPTALPNPNALTFTGAATGSYDGSEAKTINIPSGSGGGGSISLPLLYDLTTTEEVSWIDTGDNAYTVNSFLVVELVSIATTSNEADGDGSASMHPNKSDLKSPWSNAVIESKLHALLPKTYNKVFRAFCFRGEDGHWSSITAIRNEVNASSVTPRIITARADGVSDQPMRGLIIGKSWEAKSNVLGVGSRLRVWGI